MHSSIYYLNALLYTVHTHIHIEKNLDLDTLCFHHCAALAANPCSAWLRLSNCVTAIQDGLDATLLDSTWLFKAIRVDTWQNMEKLRYTPFILARLQTLWCKAMQEIADERSAMTTKNNNDVLPFTCSSYLKTALKCTQIIYGQHCSIQKKSLTSLLRLKAGAAYYLLPIKFDRRS